MVRRRGIGFAANVVGAMAMAAAPSSKAVQVNTTTPAPVMPNFVSSNTVPTTPAPQQPTQVRSERAVEIAEFKLVGKDGKPPKIYIDGMRESTQRKLHEAVIGEARDGHTTVEGHRRSHNDHAGRAHAPEGPEIARARKYFRIKNVRISSLEDLGTPVRIDRMALTRQDGTKLKEYDREDLENCNEAGIQVRVRTYKTLVAPRENPRKVARQKREGTYQTPKKKVRVQREFFLYVHPSHLDAYVGAIDAKIAKTIQQIEGDKLRLKNTNVLKDRHTIEYYIEKNLEELAELQAERELIHYKPTLEEERKEMEDKTGGKVVFDDKLLKNFRAILTAIKDSHKRRRFKAVQQRGGVRELRDGLMTPEEAIALDNADKANLSTNQAAAFDYDWIDMDIDPGIIDWDIVDRFEGEKIDLELEEAGRKEEASRLEAEAELADIPSFEEAYLDWFNSLNNDPSQKQAAQ
jgi:hypothetical protein